MAEAEIRMLLNRWGLEPTVDDVRELVAASGVVREWRDVLLQALEDRPLSDGMVFPTTEPASPHDLTTWMARR